jgi:hypothetical protein
MMTIEKTNGWIKIKVDGYPQMRYLYYSEREAIKRYRELFNLKYRRIEKVYI